LVQQSPALQLEHVEVADSNTQPCASVEHVASVVELAQILPAALQTGSVLQVHAAAPAAPVQLWRAPQGIGTPKDQQPLLPRVHVARLPETHDVWPELQLLLHASEHAALGDMPEQDIGMMQGTIEVA
jgi:hypothetical protein